MYKLCKLEQSAARQRELEQGLLEMMQTTPFEQISVTDFCTKMQIPRKAFYRYFTDKEGALYALIDHTFMEYGRFTAKESLERHSLLGDLEQFFCFWKEQKFLLDGLSRSNLTDVLVDRIVEQTMESGVISTFFMSNEPEKLRSAVMRFALYGMLAMMLKWYQNGFSTPASEQAKVMARLLTKPLFQINEIS